MTVGRDLAAMRQEYSRVGLAERDMAPPGVSETGAPGWLAQFEHWLADVSAAGLPEPNAMVVATSDPDGRPTARTVLLKRLDARGFVFFTNLRSRKATQAAANPYASLVFGWHMIGRQVLVTGRIGPIDRAETEAYFATRPRESQLGAWASPQSQVVPDRASLDAALAEVARRFDGVAAIPAPPHWGGLRVEPDSVEFWQGGVGRLHDRLRYRDDGERGWVLERLGP